MPIYSIWVDYSIMGRILARLMNGYPYSISVNIREWEFCEVDGEYL
jgi:hypothetical protein